MLSNERLQELKNELKEMLTGINWHGEKGKRYWSFWIRDHANSVVPDLLTLIDSAMTPQTDWQQKYRRCEVEREGTQNALDDNRLKLRDCLEKLGKVKENYSKATRQYEELVNAQDAMQPVSGSQMVMDSDMCDHLGAVLYPLGNAEMDGEKTVTIETKELRLMVDDYTTLIKETSADRERKYIAMQPVSEEVQRAIEHFDHIIESNPKQMTELQEVIEKYPWDKIEHILDCKDWRPLKIKWLQEQSCMYTLAIQALKQMKPTEKCDLCRPEIMDGNPIIYRHSDNYIGNGKFSIAGLIAKYCPNCGRRLESE